jgi:membrane peptidoglycan carboxypeptidase
VNTILFTGVDSVVTTLRRAGFTTLDTRPNAYGPSLTVGGVNISLADLVYGYSTLATGGVRRGAESTAERTEPDRQVDPAILLKVTDATSGEVLYEYQGPDQEEVFPASFPYMITSILSDGNNQCITFGVCGALSLPNRPAVIKTGTSEPFVNRTDLIGDTWAVGYTPQLVAGTWFGNSDNRPMVNIFSTTVSWRAWREFMIFAHDYYQLPPAQFQRPDSVVERDICLPSGKLATALCPRQFRQKALFAAETVQGPNPIALVDDWWQPGGRLVLPPALRNWSGVGGFLGRSGFLPPEPSPTPRPESPPGAPAPSQPPQQQPRPQPTTAPPSSPPAPTQPPSGTNDNSGSGNNFGSGNRFGFGNNNDNEDND